VTSSFCKVAVCHPRGIAFRYFSFGIRMNSARGLVKALKRKLKVAGITYQDLARQIGLAESNVKRMVTSGDLSLSRIDDVLRVLKMDFAELSRRIANAQSLRRELSLEQEEAVVADPKLMLLAICCISHWTFEQMVSTYLISEAECIACLLRLDQLGFIEFRPLNRYCLKVSNEFRRATSAVRAGLRAATSD
jgi:transcriptional regulator with XRE-family HTH domain